MKRPGAILPDLIRLVLAATDRQPVEANEDLTEVTSSVLGGSAYGDRVPRICPATLPTRRLRKASATQSWHYLQPSWRPAAR